MRSHSRWWTSRLPLEAKVRIDQICLDYEDALQHGRQPQIETYLESADSAIRNALLGELLALELAYHKHHGRPARLSDYEQRFPDHRDVVYEAFESADSRPQSPHLEWRPGELIAGRYRLQQRLGQGSFGTVYHAYDEQLEREVALKVPHPHWLSRPEQRGMLVQEARRAARIRHPHIVSIYDVEQSPDGHLFLVMQYVPAKPLGRWLLDHDCSPGRLAQLFARIAATVHAAHGQGIVHRDLQPGNILLDSEGLPYVTDFGLALDELSPHGAPEVAGTPAYMSPEQIAGDANRIDRRTDIWAIGVLLYEALTGRRPFQADSFESLAQMIQHDSPDPPRAMRSDLSPGLERIILKCLAKSPHNRYPSALQLADALQRSTASTLMSRRYVPVGIITALVLMAVLLVLPILRHGSLSAAGNLLRKSNASRMERAAHEEPLHGELQLSIWMPSGWRTLDDPGVVPLRLADPLRLQIELSRPGYAYVVWIDGDGEIWPVYPWQYGSWTDRASTEIEVQQLALPSDEELTAWTMDRVQDGTEMVLLLVRDSPLPVDLNLRQVLQTVPSDVLQAALRTPHPELLGSSHQQDRGPRLAAPRAVQHPIATAQHQLGEALRPYFQFVHLLSIPTQSGKRR